MINHPANSLVTCLCIALTAAAFWLLVNGCKQAAEYLETRRQRRLDVRAKREIRKQFNQIIASQDEGGTA